MKENEKKETISTEKVNSEDDALKELRDKDDPSGLDFSGVSALSNRNWVKEKWYVTFGHALLEKVLGLLLFVGTFILDIFKALWQVIKGIFVGIYSIFKGIVLWIRKLARMFREGDYGVRMSFLVNGFGNFKVGQISDGIIFLVVEVVFGLFLATRGIASIHDLIYLGEAARGMVLPNNTSITSLISGIFTILLICAYIYVWYSAVRSAYDGYVIKNNYRFLAAKQDALYVLQNKDEFPKFFKMVDKKNKYGSYRKAIYVSPAKIYSLMRKEYGYSRLSALYISYVPFRRTNPHGRNVFQRIGDAIFGGCYNMYTKVADKIKAGQWSSVFAKYLVWEPAKKKEKYGFAVIENELSANINRHRHTFDKYNVYIPHVRDAKAVLSVIQDPELLEKAIYAEDPVSVRNGLAPIAHGTKVKAKVAASRIIGAFGCSFAAAVTAVKIYNTGLAASAKDGKDPKEYVAEAAAKKQQALDLFVENNLTKRNASNAGVMRAYTEYATLRSTYDQGPSVFLGTLKNEFGIFADDAERVYRDYKIAIAAGKDDDEEVARRLRLCAKRYSTLSAIYDSFPFYGQPLHFAKKSKQYLDEKFAVTVLAFPVLGAVVFSLLPLLFSIVIAFTTYNYGKNPNPIMIGNFDWSTIGFQSLLGLGSGNSLLPTFMYILGWTIIWAFFATFMNYILGIVVALLINNKHIKLKKLWRTMLVISIAVPQFITLLAMNRMLDPTGPLNSWFVQMGWSKGYSMFWLNDPTNDGLIPKIMLITINCWIGIPFTMLSTTGILLNIPEDLYESARIDGASPWTQFWKITMPYILFVTGPSLLTSFIGNINNFNVIYFLTGGGPSSNAMSSVQLVENAGLTDLLITWLYKMTVNAAQPKYATGSVLGIMIFAICAFFSLIVYKRMGSTQNEEAFQ